MRREPPLPPELWNRIPLEVQAALLLVVEGYEQLIATLEAEVAELKGEVRELKAQLGQGSQNSSRPPSSDGLYVKRKPSRASSGRKRGGQPGHPVHQRALLLVEQVDAVIVCKPTYCRRCGGALQGSDVEPLGMPARVGVNGSPSPTLSGLEVSGCVRSFMSGATASNRNMMTLMSITRTLWKGILMR